MKNIRRRINISDELETKSTSISSSFKDIGNSVVSNLWDELLRGSTKEATKQVVGLEKGEEQVLQEGQEITLTKRQEAVAELKTIQHMEYFRGIRSSETTVERGEHAKMEKRVQEILVELKKITKTSKEMQSLFKKVATEQAPLEPGTYHVNFLDWMLLVVRQARTRIEEGAAWLRMFASKKKQKQYWNMFEKHGTSFGLSGERTPSTQIG